MLAQKNSMPDKITHSFIHSFICKHKLPSIRSPLTLFCSAFHSIMGIDDFLVPHHHHGTGTGTENHYGSKSYLKQDCYPSVARFSSTILFIYATHWNGATSWMKEVWTSVIMYNEHLFDNWQCTPKGYEMEVLDNNVINMSCCNSLQVYCHDQSYPGNKGTSAEAHKKDFFIPREHWVFLDDKAKAILYGRESTNFSNELPLTQRPLANMHNYSVPQEKG